MTRAPRARREPPPVSTDATSPSEAETSPTDSPSVVEEMIHNAEAETEVAPDEPPRGSARPGEETVIAPTASHPRTPHAKEEYERLIGNEKEIEEKIQEFVGQFGGGDNPVKFSVHRETPTHAWWDPSEEIRGWSLDFYEPFTIAQVAAIEGGGRFRVTAYSPMPGGASYRIRDNWWFKISGKPRRKENPEDKKNGEDMSMAAEMLKSSERAANEARAEVTARLADERVAAEKRIAELRQEADRRLEDERGRHRDEMAALKADLAEVRRALTTPTGPTAAELARLEADKAARQEELALKKRELDLKEAEIREAKEGRIAEAERVRQHEATVEREKAHQAELQRAHDEKMEARRAAEDERKAARDQAQALQTQVQNLITAQNKTPDTFGVLSTAIPAFKGLASALGLSGSDAPGKDVPSPMELLDRHLPTGLELARKAIEQFGARAQLPAPAAPGGGFVPAGDVTMVDLVPTAPRRRVIPRAPPAPAPTTMHPLLTPVPAAAAAAAAPAAPAVQPETPPPANAAVSEDTMAALKDLTPLEQFVFPGMMDSTQKKGILLAKNLDLALRRKMTPAQVKVEVLDKFDMLTVAAIKGLGPDKAIAMISEYAPQDWLIAGVDGAKMVEELFKLL